MQSFTSILTEEIPPRASVLAESLRAFGYNIGTAIADIVDNAISAGASNVWVDFVWSGKDSSIFITDDGCGMSEARLRDAMRLGSRHPGERRAANDLGRFGLGMKTASFSQCRCVTVSTKEVGQKSVLRRWDLDYLAIADSWQVLLEARQNSERHFQRLDGLPSGTCVLWEHMDRVMRGLDSGAESDRDGFIALCEEVERHLALVFHRLLESPFRLRIFVNEHPVSPFDPFFISTNTQELPVNPLSSPGGIVLVEPFVMPHESKLLDENERRLAGDPKDWTARQGFYIYRQDRLLVPGSWLGYPGWRKDEHHKLARIRISLPNTSDEDWQIDVTKSKARPPHLLRDKLLQIGKKTRESARRVYSFRGERISQQAGGGICYVWDQIALRGAMHYRVNRQHPLISVLLEDKIRRGPTEAALKLIEDTIPVNLIAYQATESQQSPPVTDEADVTEIRKMMIDSWKALRLLGRSSVECLQVLSTAEPFNLHPALLQEINEKPPA